jgi:hypothetical protein
MNIPNRTSQGSIVKLPQRLDKNSAKVDPAIKAAVNRDPAPANP